MWRTALENIRRQEMNRLNEKSIHLSKPCQPSELRSQREELSDPIKINSSFIFVMDSISKHSNIAVMEGKTLTTEEVEFYFWDRKEWIWVRPVMLLGVKLNLPMTSIT